MHIPDGFLDVATCATTAMASAAVVGLALRGARRELDDRAAPLTGLVAAFVFAAQMVNFPVAAGTSGHLLGAALAVALMGPWTAVLCLTVVLLVQCLLFADGGLTALGANTWNMAVVAVALAWLTQTIILTLLPRRSWSVVAASAVSGFIAVLGASSSFCLLFQFGGTVEVPMAQVWAGMTSVHLLIGAAEGAITALVVGAVVGLRPELVSAARGLLAEAPLVVRTQEVAA